MHYYKRNLGDYAKKAGRLSMLEHGAYTLLIDACYDREQFPTKQEAIEWCWARTADEIAAVEFVLSRFFELDGNLYVQGRIKEEIDKYHENAARNSKIATEREANRTDRARSVHKSSPKKQKWSPNQEPLTKNQEPGEEDTLSPPAPGTTKQQDLFDEFWAAYPKKVGKDAARKAFGKRDPGKTLVADMLAALAVQRQSEQWRRDGGQYIPNPATWLNEGRWQDGEPVETSPQELFV